MSAPILLCDTKGMDRKRWLECRMHGPKGDIEFTIGGSDVSTVFAENPWTTPLELWRIKKGLMLPDDSSNAEQKEMGNLMEPIVAHWYGKLTGNDVIADTGLYQHSKYPYALANLDYRTKDAKTGENGVLECKTTTWRNADSWADDAVPRYYELQVRFYLAVMDLSFADIACLWGTNPKNDMAIRRINRDLAIEAIIFEKLDEFIFSLRANTPPTMADVVPAHAMAALARIYKASIPSLPTIEFGTKQERQLRRIAALQNENAEHSKLIRENEKEVTALSVRIAEAMKDHEHGILETSADKILVDFVTKVSHRTDSTLLKNSYPVIYDEVQKQSQSRKLQVSVHAK